MIKLWNRAQVDLEIQKNQSLDNKKLPDEVFLAAKDAIDILDKYYGSKRDPEKDLGGVIYICNTKEEHKSLLDKYGTTEDMVEFTDIIIVNENQLEKQRYQWFQKLYIISNDYSLVIIYKDDI